MKIGLIKLFLVHFCFCSQEREVL